MKRLLSANSGPIYQICHSFRNSESGQYHNPEFTMLEWYQPFYLMHELIKEVDMFLQVILGCKQCDKISYQDIFIQYLNIDPLSTKISEIRHKSKELELEYLTDRENNLEKLIELLFLCAIEPNIGKNKPLIIYHFPISQASLAAVNIKDSRVSDRFEIFFQGIELGNGFYELTDHAEQKKRFIEDNKRRLKMNLPVQDLDPFFLDALLSGLSPCSGVAIGLDRLIMLMLKKKRISQVMAFSLKNC